MKWSNSILRTMRDFQRQTLYCDVLLESVDGQSVPAHACIIGACSPQLHQELISDGAYQPGTVIRMPLNICEIHDLISVIYSGSVDFPLEHRSAELLSILSNLSVTLDDGVLSPVELAVKCEVLDMDATHDKDGAKTLATSWITEQTFGNEVPVADVTQDKEEAGKNIGSVIGNRAQSPMTGGTGLPKLGAISNNSKNSEKLDATGARDLPNDIQERIDVRTTELETGGAEEMTGAPHSPDSKAKSTSKEKRSSRTVASDTSRECEICGKHFSSAYNRARHVLSHSGVKPYKCRFCDKTFSRHNHRTQHENIHTKSIVYQCRFCGSVFEQYSRLYYHESCHASSGKYKCNQCDKTFAFKASLKSHQRMHTGEKPHQCSECGKYYSSVSVLKNHERAHRGEKKHSCVYCSKAFVTHAEKISHERVHTGVKPYECRLCQKAFRTQSARLEHEKTHPEFLEPALDGTPGMSKAGFKLLKKKPKVDKPKEHACQFCGKKWEKNCHRLRHEKRVHLGNNIKTQGFSL